MNPGYAILVLLALAILLQLLLWRAHRAGLRQLREYDQRLALLEKHLDLGEGGAPRLAGETPAPAAARPVPADPLQQAIALARAGRSAQEIAASCGISEAESELLVRMRGAPM